MSATLEPTLGSGAMRFDGDVPVDAVPPRYRLGDTFAWAERFNVLPLRKAIKSSKSCPLIAVGSGGSLTAASALAHLHQTFGNQLGTVCTPLEIASVNLTTSASYWLLSSGGSNVDINRAAETLISREPRQERTRALRGGGLC